jgi:3-oxoacid CoA-transferase B subunit
VNAGKQYIALDQGGAITDQVDSFALVRAGYIDVAVLGAYQVSADGDLANWKRPWEDIAGVGGAVDIATGAADVWVVMRSRSKDGTAKVVKECDFPLTARGVVTRVYTELGVLQRERGGRGFAVQRRAPGVDSSAVDELLAAAS